MTQLHPRGQAERDDENPDDEVIPCPRLHRHSPELLCNTCLGYDRVRREDVKDLLRIIEESNVAEQPLRRSITKKDDGRAMRHVPSASVEWGGGDKVEDSARHLEELKQRLIRMEQKLSHAMEHLEKRVMNQIEDLCLLTQSHEEDLQRLIAEVRNLEKKIGSADQ